MFIFIKMCFVLHLNSDHNLLHAKFRTSGILNKRPSNDCALRICRFSNHWYISLVRRTASSKFRTSGPSNKWAFEQVGRPTCSKAHIFEILNKWIFEQLPSNNCASRIFSFRTTGTSNLFEGPLVRISNKWTFEQLGL